MSKYMQVKREAGECVVCGQLTMWRVQLARTYFFLCRRCFSVVRAAETKGDGT